MSWIFCFYWCISIIWFVDVKYFSNRRNAYERILSGNWEEHDPFLVGGRGVCKMDEHCSFFRAFQGWTSLSEAGPGDGTLR